MQGLIIYIRLECKSLGTNRSLTGGCKPGYRCDSFVFAGRQARKWVLQTLQMSHNGKNCSNPPWDVPLPASQAQPRSRSNASPKPPTSPRQPRHLLHQQWVQVQPLHLASDCLNALPSRTPCFLSPVLLLVFSLKMGILKTVSVCSHACSWRG